MCVVTNSSSLMAREGYDVQLLRCVPAKCDVPAAYGQIKQNSNKKQTAHQKVGQKGVVPTHPVFLLLQTASGGMNDSKSVSGVAKTYAAANRPP